ncbi:phosphatidylinositol glycan anchor biosynthesis class U protein-like [Halichondria panicea]|uniref:phosphatidylinositol glycan anchor biosynthesis class U protein-like n=1 Tax=Halichondria panicea TaxID=6063 RepID=UPI00312B578E
MIMSYRDGCVFGAAKQLCLMVCWSAVLLGGSAWVMGSWDYMQAVYGVMLSVPDQTPNLGLLWYFFTETFEHFRIFFLCVFQMNAFIYVIPLTIRFRSHPVFLTYILLSVTTLFKSYPCLGDLTIPLALLPLWTHTFRYLRYTLVVVVMFLASSLLCPVLWYLWIHAGSANANFFFAMTLTYSLAQIFLVADVIYSFLVHQYDLKHGLPRLDQLGKPVKLKLY